ncbi:MAG: DUF4190 domain-containing protein, partial [Micromonosporaceae bacterium]
MPGYPPSGPAGYPPAYPQAPGYGAPPGNNGMAIGSMCTGIGSVVLGVLGCCLGIIAGIPALLAGGVALALGFVSMKQIDQSQGQSGGKGMAIAGLVTGGIGALIGLVWIVLSILYFAGAFDGLNNY